jgi:hypothetical protein
VKLNNLPPININRLLTNLIMKKVTFFAAIAMIAFTTNAVAQSSATDFAATDATVIAPITIAKTIDMNFGNLVSTVDGGAIVLPTTGVRTGVAAILAGPDGSPTAASFTVGGEVDYTYGITLPAAAFNVENGDATAATMEVGTFVSSPDATATSLTGGEETLLVGATITLLANQASGVYTNTTDMIVTVFYN